MIQRFLIAIFAAATTLLGAQTANTIDLNVNTEDLEVSLSQLQNFSSNPRFYYSADYLKAYDEEDREQSMISGQMMIIGLTEIRGFTAGLGLKGLVTRIDTEGDDLDAAAVAVRLRLAYTLPLVVKTTVAVSGGYAPKSLCFSDLEGYTEMRGQVEAEVIEGGLVYGGLRKLDMKFKDIDDTYTFNSAPYVGIKFLF